MKRIFPLIAAAAILAPLQLNAETIQFQGTVNSECEISVDTPGKLETETSTQLATTATGGNAGVATITANAPNAFSAMVTDPTVWTSVTAGGTDQVDDIFTTSTQLTGVTEATLNGGDSQLLGAGVTTATVGLTVDRNTGIFTAGVYSVDVTITCQ